MTTPKTDTQFNGWTNQETWTVSLWINNDENTQRRYLEMATEQPNPHVLADLIWDSYTDMVPDVATGFWADLLGVTLARVNWLEIANSLLEV